MMDVHYRPAEERDLEEAVDLFLTTRAELIERNVIPPSPLTTADVLPIYRHIWQTGIFEVACVDGRIGSICYGVVRDDRLFVSGVWTLPTLQGKKIMRPLFSRVLKEGQCRGASAAFGWAVTNPHVIELDSKMGMLPRRPMVTFAGRPSALPDADSRYSALPLTRSFAMSVDREVLATAREADHAFWLSGPGRGYEVRCDGQPAGYYYVTGGVIGPGAWLSPEHGDALVGLALREAAKQAESVRIAAVGTNHTAIKAALDARLRLVVFGLLVSTGEPVGRLDQYLPSGPSLF